MQIFQDEGVELDGVIKVVIAVGEGGNLDITGVYDDQQSVMMTYLSSEGGYSCDNGMIEIRYSINEFNYGLVMLAGRGSVTLAKLSDGALAIKQSAVAAAAILLVPFPIAAHEWLRYRPYIEP